MSQSRIAELASRIAANTAKLDDYLSANGLPTPSFDVNGPTGSSIPKNENLIETSRESIIDDTLELRRLVLGPRDYLMSFPHNELLTQQAIVRFGLARSFPVGSETTFAEMASKSGLSEASVRQIIRMATLQHIFSEPRPGVITHTSVSRLLAEDQPLADWVGASVDDLWQAASQTCNAMAKYPGSQEPNETGFSLANGTDKSIYEHFNQYPERASRFANAMRSYIRSPGFDLAHVVDHYPWGQHENGTIVDIGGSQGFVCFAIAKKNPSLSFVVQDLEPVIESAKREAPSDKTADRVKFMVHDFLTEQPVHGADVYFFRWIFHNWSDKYCIRILRNLIPALKPGARVIINDGVLPEPGMMSRWKETSLRSTDITMLEIQNSRERELEDWSKLFSEADPRFEFQEAKQPEGSNLWIIVAEWKESAN